MNTCEFHWHADLEAENAKLRAEVEKVQKETLTAWNNWGKENEVLKLQNGDLKKTLTDEMEVSKARKLVVDNLVVTASMNEEEYEEQSEALAGCRGKLDLANLQNDELKLENLAFVNSVRGQIDRVCQERDAASLQNDELRTAVRLLSLVTQSYHPQLSKEELSAWARVNTALTGHVAEKPVDETALLCVCGHAGGLHGSGWGSCLADALEDKFFPVCPCAKFKVAEKRKDDGSKCPACGRGVAGVDPLCDKHYSEYLGTNRARGNGPGD